MIYLDDHLDTLESLPHELARSFQQIRQLDAESNQIVEKTRDETQKFLADAEEMTDAEKAARLGALLEPLRRVLAHGEEKAARAIRTYDMVDRHINRLHDDLLKFQSDQLVSPKIVGGPGSRALRGGDAGTPVPRYGNTSWVREQGLSAARNGSGHSSDDAAGSTHTTGVSRRRDEPDQPAQDDIDPNEPRYCYCGGPSFGDMVACDNEDCDIEWFHYICVGLSAPPKGQWFCKDCQRKLKSGGH